MDKLKKLTEEYLKLSDKCDGTSETFAALHPLAEDLADRVKDLQLSARSREVRYALAMYSNRFGELCEMIFTISVLSSSGEMSQRAV